MLRLSLILFITLQCFTANCQNFIDTVKLNSNNVEILIINKENTSTSNFKNTTEDNSEFKLLKLNKIDWSNPENQGLLRLFLLGVFILIIILIYDYFQKLKKKSENYKKQYKL